LLDRGSVRIILNGPRQCWFCSRAFGADGPVYRTTEQKASDVVNGQFNTVADTVAATLMEHDILDRNTKTTIPDASFTTIAYGFGPDRSGTTQFETVVTDANVNAGVRGAVRQPTAARADAHRRAHL
jgi:hypothetical protein